MLHRRFRSPRWGGSQEATANLLPGRYLHSPQQLLELWVSLPVQELPPLPTPFSQPCPAMCNSPEALLSRGIFHFTGDFLLLSPERCSTQQAVGRKDESPSLNTGQTQSRTDQLRHLVHREEGTLPHRPQRAADQSQLLQNEIYSSTTPLAFLRPKVA